MKDGTSIASSMNERTVREALHALDEGARTLESAYRELWSARERERRGGELALAEKVRDLGHELKNPLAGVRGLASLLERELRGEGSGEKALRLVGRVREGLSHVEAILAARLAEPEGASDARAVTLEVADLARAEAHASGREVEFEVEAAEGVDLPIAPTLLREILGNLVQNAAEAGPIGPISIHVQSLDEEVFVDVVDDGCGLPLFSSDTLLSRGVSTKGPHRGRGLAIVSDLLIACGGSLELTRLPRGTKARVRFPRRSA